MSDLNTKAWSILRAEGQMSFGDLRARLINLLDLGTSVSEERALDRALQRLRKAGQIVYRNKKWYAEEGEE